MRRVIALVLVFVMLFSMTALAKKRKRIYKKRTVFAQSYKALSGLGVGVVIGMGFTGGTNAGISLKNWISKEHAIQGDFAWDFGSGSMGIGVAYLIHAIDLFQTRGFKLPVYFGIKGYAGISSAAVGLGIQVPVGLAWVPKDAPIDVFLQVEPGISIIPSTAFAGNGGVGIRYWF